jgi:hypothetical protein
MKRMAPGARKGELPGHFRLGRRHLVAVASLDRFLVTRKVRRPSDVSAAADECAPAPSSAGTSVAPNAKPDATELTQRKEV